MLTAKIDLSYSIYQNHSTSTATNLKIIKLVLIFPTLYFYEKRGGLKLAQYKIQETTNSLNLERLQLSNKIKAQKEVITSLNKQRLMASDLVNNYVTMLQSEELFYFWRKFTFLINSRESSLITAQLNAIGLRNEFLYRTLNYIKLWPILIK
jgi:hypothetical protein